MRYFDWPERLFNTINTAKKVDFSWGEQDCAIFVFDCVEAMTGVDHVKDLRGKYSCRRSCDKAFEEVKGTKTLLAFADKCLEKRVDLARAQRGDVVLLVINSIESFGIVAGRVAVFLEIKKGIQTVPVKDCSYAWRVD